MLLYMAWQALEEEARERAFDEEQRDGAADPEEDSAPGDEPLQMSFAGGRDQEILEGLRNLDVNTLTPIESMNYLYEIARKAKES